MTAETKNLIKDTCKALGITQKELAERMGVAEITISRYVTELPLQAKKMIELIIENHDLKQRLDLQKQFFEMFDKLRILSK